MGSSIKDVRRKGEGEGECGRKRTTGRGFQRKRTSAYLSNVDLEDRAVCVSACKPEPIAAFSVCLAGTPARRQCGQSIAVAGAATARQWHNVSTASAAVVPPVSPPHPHHAN